MEGMSPVCKYYSSSPPEEMIHILVQPPNVGK
jgi:hypothetical protein